jgi:hypothetical protein
LRGVPQDIARNSSSKRSPYYRRQKTEELKGLSSEFDSWAYGLVATAIPLDYAEKPAGLWQPILSLSAPEHQWGGRFYWQWFKLGWKSTSDTASFSRERSAMIEFALTRTQWNHRGNWHHAIDAVYELMSFNTNWSNWIQAGSVSSYARAQFLIELVLESFG